MSPQQNPQVEVEVSVMPPMPPSTPPEPTPRRGFDGQIPLQKDEYHDGKTAVIPFATWDDSN